jgi:hypothetical protein
LDCIFPACIAVVIVIIILSAVLFLAFSSTFLASHPIYAQEQIRLEAFSDQGTFKIEIIWIPNDIGSSNILEIHFVDPDTVREIEDIKYDISIYRDDSPEIQRIDQTSIFQHIFFKEMGSYQIRIEDIEDLGEGAIIPIQVTLEFNLKVVMLSAAAIGILVLATRANNGNNLFRHPIN